MSLAKWREAELLRMFGPAGAVLPILAVGAVLLLSPRRISAQGLELTGGWQHITGNNGTNGYVVGAGWWFTPKVSLAASWDEGWNTSQLTAFALTDLGAVVVKNHVQNFLTGPRVFFPYRKLAKYKLDPFVELQFGVSHLSTSIQRPTVETVSSAGTGFSWMLGTGAQYQLNPHWAVRVNIDLLRTHLAAAGQSHLRGGVSVVYTFGKTHGH